MRPVSKLDLAVIAAAMVGGVVWLEHRQRISINVPTPAEMAWRVAVAACPDNDSVPYTPTCLAFLGSSRARSPDERVSLAETPEHTRPLDSGSQCPENDNRPYPPACVRFLSGWFWRVD